MQWINEPKDWEYIKGNLTIGVTPKTDFWRITHYGFIVDDGPFYYSQHGGEFEVTVKVIADYKARFDQTGLMLRIDEENWIKTGIEFVDEKYNYSTVVTNGHSSWSVIELKHMPEAVWIKAIRKTDAVEIFFSLDGKNFQMSNLCYFPEVRTAMVGMVAASPDGNGFKAIFENFKVKHLPDQRRLNWLNK